MSAIEDALDDCLAAGEVGLQVAAYLDGELVVHACAGRVGPTPDAAEVTADTLFPILSAVKALTAVAVHVQAERGLLAYEQPVAQLWPEFGANGKASVTIADVLCHRAGIPQLPAGTTVERIADWEGICGALAALAPAYRPGTANAYHALSWGFVLGEVVRRSDPERRPFGAFAREEICAPLQIDDLWIGIPPTVNARVAEVVAASYPGPPARLAPLRAAAVPPELGPPHVFQNDPAFRQACIPAGNGISTARSLARLYALLAGGGTLDGVTLLSPSRVAWCAQPRPGFAARDLVTGDVSPVGRGGFQLGRPPAPATVDAVVGGAPGSLWHPGGGGTYAWADRRSGLAVAICHNRLVPAHAGSEGCGRRPLFAPLADALRAVAGIVGAPAGSAR
ncbi:MAG TPA: serine hydrolase domain-containing protein [Conexibacter sp.]|jgi:CubicO group peptidase (beta-lactamase class C family)